MKVSAISVGRAFPDPARFKSASFQRLLARARRYAADRHATLLLEGESGSGKTILARYLHSVSPRSSKPFHSVVLSTVDDGLAASELFGHVTGAYTDARHARAGHFASANGGTLFLDEIGKALSWRAAAVTSRGGVWRVSNNVTVVRILDAAREAAKTGKTVVLEGR